MKRIWTFCLVLVLILSMAASALGEQAKVQGGSLRLRALPNEQGTVLSVYKTGTVVDVLSKTGIWWRVRTPDGKEGYMMSSFLGPVVDPIPTGSGKGIKAYVTSENGLSVNMRSGPGKNYGSLGSYDVGTQVTILATTGSWSYIRVGAKLGYMMSKYLSADPVIPTKGKTYKATVTSSNGYGVRMRSGPGTGYSVIGFYSVGTEATILNRGTSWHYIQIGSRKGYMLATFLYIHGTSPTKTPKPTATPKPSRVIAGVSIDKLNPKVGATLNATVYPDGASAAVVWYNDENEQIGAGDSYKLTDADGGYRIYCIAYGTGDWTGSASSALTNKVKVPN